MFNGLLGLFGLGGKEAPQPETSIRRCIRHCGVLPYSGHLVSTTSGQCYRLLAIIPFAEECSAQGDCMEVGDAINSFTSNYSWGAETFVGYLVQDDMGNGFVETGSTYEVREGEPPAGFWIDLEAEEVAERDSLTKKVAKAMKKGSKARK